MMRFSAALAAATVAWASISLAADISPSTRPVETAPAAGTQPAAIDYGMVLAHTSEGDFTAADLEQVFAAQLPAGTDPGAASQRLLHPRAALESMAAQYLAERQIAREYLATSPTLPAQWRDTLVVEEGREMFSHLSREIVDSVETPTDEEALAYYGANRVKYHTPFHFYMRHLALTTYVPYTSKQGDTLESIAREISGSEDAVAGILTAADGHLQRWVPPEARDRRPFVPLEPGEALLVPMSPQDREALRRMLEETIIPQLKSGVPLADLARDLSEAPDKGAVIGPLPFATTPMLPEILQAARTLPVGQPSGVIETSKGFEIIQVTQRQEEEWESFDAAKEQIKEDLRNQKLRDELTDLLASQWSRLHIDTEKIADPQTDPQAIVISTDHAQWTLADVERLIGKALGVQRSPSAIISTVRNNDLFASQLNIELGRERGLDQIESLMRRIQVRKEHYLAQKLIEQETERRKAQLGDADYRQWYEERIDRFTPPSRFKVRQIVVRLDSLGDLSRPGERRKAEQAALEKLRGATEGIETQEEFIAAVRRVTEDPAGRAALGYIGEVLETDKTGQYAQVLRSLKSQTPSEPFVQGDMAYVLWLDERIDPEPPDFETHKTAIQQQMWNELARTVEAEMRQQALEALRYEEPAQ